LILEQLIAVVAFFPWPRKARQIRVGGLFALLLGILDDAG
jgi:hypothetical protein